MIHNCEESIKCIESEYKEAFGRKIMIFTTEEEMTNKKRHQIYPREESPDMLMLDLFLAHLKTMRSCQKNMGLSYRCFELRRDTWNE